MHSVFMNVRENHRDILHMIVLSYRLSADSVVIYNGSNKEKRRYQI